MKQDTVSPKQIALDAIATLAAKRPERPAEFWMAMQRCENALAGANEAAEILAVLKLFKWAVRSPADFGYGTPCSDAVLAVFEAIVVLEKELKLRP